MADFLGGLATRRVGLVVAVVGLELVGLVFAVVALGLTTEPLPTAEGVAWAAVGGAIGVTGLAALYRGLATGVMSLVSPIAAAIAAALPAIVGATLLGERLTPFQQIGVAVAIAAVTVVSLPRGSVTLAPAQLSLAIAAGLGFGLFFVAIDQAEKSGIGTWWLLAVVRGISTLLVAAAVAVIVARGFRFTRPTPAMAGLLVATGATDLGGNAFTAVSLPLESLGVVAVLSSLYPVITVLLAVAFLGERLGAVQIAGVVLAFIAIALIAAGYPAAR